MKKLTVVLIAVAAFGFISSCKSREKCPAYGKVKTHTHSTSRS